MSPRTLINTTRPGDWRVAAPLLGYLWRHRGVVGVALVWLCLARLANVSVPLVLKELVDGLSPERVLLGVPLALLAAYAALRFSSVLFNELRNVLFSRVSAAIVRDFSNDLFDHLHRLSLHFHLQRKTGSLASDIERGQQAMTNFLRMIVFTILPVALEMLLMLYLLGTRLDARFVWITLATIALYTVFTLLMTRWRTHFRVEMNRADSAAKGHALDALLNYETVKIFGAQADEARRYDRALGDWMNASIASNRSLAWLNCGQALIIAAGLFILLFLAAEGVSDRSLSLGDFVMVNAFLLQLYIPLNFLGSIYRDMNHALIDLERVFALRNEPVDIVDAPDARPLEVRQGVIEFERVSFAWPGRPPLLEDISFTVGGGRMLAVVGPSGAGKTTLARLLLRFYEPTGGDIRIDGQTLSGVTLDSLRAAVSMVAQDCVLFNDTIGYNIAYGRPNATQAEIEKAARLARIDDFIRHQPQGYEALVGERGLKLSGGEKQRVAIARAAIKGAPIIVFDEATSSLDSHAERAIQQSLEHLAKNATTLVIAHRLSTIVNADQIIVLEQGKICERGSHTELLEANGLYARLWKLQQLENN